MNSGDGFQYMHTTGSNASLDIGLLNLLSGFGSLVDGSLFQTNDAFIQGNIAIQEAFGCISKFAGALVLWLSTRSNFKCKQSGNLKHGTGHSCTRVKDVRSCALDFVRLDTGHSGESIFLNKKVAFFVRDLFMGFGRIHLHPLLSLAAAVVPPIDNLSSKLLAIPLENHPHESIDRLMGQVSTSDDRQGCHSLAWSHICWSKDRVEPMTGITFPSILESDFGRKDMFNQCMEVLVGTGARSMNIVKFKSLKLYAFGLYVQPDSICEQLGPKYASVPVSELQEHSEFFEDLLRADVHMTVRLVINCNGIKITKVKDNFEKSLRTRLEKMNSDADYHSLSTFGSYFTPDITLPPGTIIDFRKTADGKLITEIGGKHIGAVKSKDLCRAFFDMYIGEAPVSSKAKQEVAENIADLIRRC